ncbi:unnamed protein product [Mesocestoides corti]|uniref:Ubiquitin-like domain-containing protein n=1 Tax=Mesocestoides corti TaxID=53468 RepID=A0A0R3ULS0_MESCO|nr:unnamed protein product [Mesocestoides corti]
MATDTGIFPAANENGESFTETTNSRASVHLTVIHNRKRYPLELSPDLTVRDLKLQLEALTNVPADMQKLIFQGILQDETTLSELKLPSSGVKIMLIGSERSATDKIRNQVAVSATPEKTEDDTSAAENWSTTAEHRRVLTSYGKPEDAIVGFSVSEVLPDDQTLVGLHDKRGRALRLRFKAETHELWLATTSATHKIPLSTIQAVDHQPIVDDPGYHIMAFQLGPTIKSRFFVYWVPAQYVESIKTKALQHKCQQRKPP